MEEVHCLACTCEGRVATRGGAREGRADLVALALRVAKGAEEVDAGLRAVPVMPLAALAPGLATEEAPDIAGAMRARLGKIADGSLGERKKKRTS